MAGESHSVPPHQSTWTSSSGSRTSAVLKSPVGQVMKTLTSAWAAQCPNLVLTAKTARGESQTATCTLKLHTEPAALQQPPVINTLALPHFPSDNADQGSLTQVCHWVCDMLFQTTADFPGKPAPEPDGVVKLSQNLLPSPPWKQHPTTTNTRSFLITNTFWQQAGWAGSAHRSPWASVIRILSRAKLDLQMEMDHLEG